MTIERANIRDDVLFAFHQACANPSADDIIAWTGRYPQFAADIRAHAAILKDWAARRNLPADEPDELMLMRTRVRALDSLHAAMLKEKGAKVIPRRRPIGECAFCDKHGDDPMMPSHTPSDRCESGKHPHCTCDICY